jgi:hypothetical protein
MAFDREAAINAMVTLVGTITGMQSVRKGVPETFATTASAYVAHGGNRWMPDATQVYRAERSLIVGFGYRVSGAETTAEQKVGQFADEFERKILQNRVGSVGAVTALLNGSVEHMEPAESLGDDPEYRAMVGQEWRLLPYLVRYHQLEVIG